MAGPVRKMSEVMLKMAEHILRKSAEDTSDEAAHAALFFANIAWNECVGIDNPRNHHRKIWETFEASNPSFWNELKSNNTDALIDDLVRYKQAHYPEDRRRILICGMMPNGNIRVEWLPTAAPGVDPKWELQLYGLVRTGDQPGAIRFLRKTRGLSRNEAMKQVAAVATGLGIK
ncbi:hypothetical protein V5E97_02700 [Singulisphaera sp. Ch08]|uniref:Uncharacterized protein n=1 Tax=Singulisphaera sp. Ch08 TaxID=3120278 RepID=A0AAU7CIJ2_9BACT